MTVFYQVDAGTLYRADLRYDIEDSVCKSPSQIFPNRLIVIHSYSNSGHRRCTRLGVSSIRVVEILYFFLRYYVGRRVDKMRPIPTRMAMIRLASVGYTGPIRSIQLRTD